MMMHSLLAMGAPAGDTQQDPKAQMIQLIAMFAILGVMFYFLMIRPQQQRMKAHQALVAGVKRNDTVVLNSGVIGKVVRVEDKEIGLEIAQGVTIKVVKAMISDVRTRGEPAAANDAKV